MLSFLQPPALPNLPEEILDTIFLFLGPEPLVEKFSSFPKKNLVQRIFRKVTLFSHNPLQQVYYLKKGRHNIGPFWISDDGFSVCFGVKDLNFSIKRLDPIKSYIISLDIQFSSLGREPRSAPIQEFIGLLPSLNCLSSRTRSRIFNNLSNLLSISLSEVIPFSWSFETRALRKLTIIAASSKTFVFSRSRYPVLASLHLTSMDLVTNDEAPMLKEVGVCESDLKTEVIMKLGHVETLCFLSKSFDLLSEFIVSPEAPVLPGVKKVVFSQFDVSKIAINTVFPNCKQLEILGNKLKVPNILNLPALTSLKMSEVLVAKLEDIKCETLESLVIERSLTKRFPFSTESPYLNTLTISLARLTSFTRRFEYLKLLDMSFNEVEYLDNISLPLLESLDLSGNPLRGFKTVDLPSLLVLDVSFCRLQDVNFVSKLPRLKSLLASYNRIEDARGINGHKTLKHVDLHNNIKKLAISLANLPNFELVTVSMDPGPVVSKSRDLRSLYGFDASMWNLPNFTSFTSSNRAIELLIPFSFFTSLKTLTITDSPITSMSGLQSLVNLETLDLSRCDITQISYLNSDKLKVLVLEGNPLDSTLGEEQLPVCRSLEKLVLDGSGVFSLEGDVLSKVFPNLKVLHAQNCNLSYLPFFNQMTSLTELLLRGNAFSELDHLHDLPNLRVLDLSSNDLEVIDYEFTGFPSLEVLKLEDNFYLDVEHLPALRLGKYVTISLPGGLKNEIDRDAFPRDYTILFVNDVTTRDDDYRYGAGIVGGIQVAEDEDEEELGSDDGFESDDLDMPPRDRDFNAAIYFEF